MNLDDCLHVSLLSYLLLVLLVGNTMLEPIPKHSLGPSSFLEKESLYKKTKKQTTSTLVVKFSCEA